MMKWTLWQSWSFTNLGNPAEWIRIEFTQYAHLIVKCLIVVSVSSSQPTEQIKRIINHKHTNALFLMTWTMNSIQWTSEKFPMIIYTNITLEFLWTYNIFEHLPRFMQLFPVQGGSFAVSWSLDQVLGHLALLMLTVQGGLKAVSWETDLVLRTFATW